MSFAEAKAACEGRGLIVEANVRSMVKAGKFSGIEALLPGAVSNAFGNSYRQQSKARDAYRMAKNWVAACTNVIAKRVAGQNWFAGHYQEKPEESTGGKKPPKRRSGKTLTKAAESGEIKHDKNHAVLWLLDKPNKVQGKSEFLQITVMNLLLTGEWYWIGGVTKGGKAEVLAVPSSWIVPQHKDGLFSGYKLQTGYGGEGIDLAPENVARGYFPDPSDIKGCISPLASCIQAAKIDEYILNSQEASFERGINPNLIITIGSGTNPDGTTTNRRPTLRGAQRRQIVRAVRHIWSQTVNQGDPAILDGLIEDVKKLQMTPQEMDWKDSGEVVKARICQAYGTNPIIMGEITPSNKAQAVVAETSFCGNVVNPLLGNISSAASEFFSNFYDDGESLAVWLEEAVPKDDEREDKQWQQARAAGDVTQDEVRARMKLEPLKQKPPRSPLFNNPQILAAVANLCAQVGGGVITHDAAVQILITTLQISEEDAGKMVPEDPPEPTPEELAAQAAAQQVAQQRPKRLKYDPNQPRDDVGRWSDDSGGWSSSGSDSGSGVTANADAETIQAASEIIGKEVTANDIAASIGAPEGATVSAAFDVDDALAERIAIKLRQMGIAPSRGDRLGDKPKSPTVAANVDKAAEVSTIAKYNENHDEQGRFSSGDSNGSSQQSGSGSGPASASDSGGSGNGGGVSGAASGVESAGAAPAVSTERLAGSPTSAKIRGLGEVEVAPFIPARQAAADYMHRAGLEYDPPTSYAKVDKDRAKKIADAYESMKHDPDDPEVKEAYQAMATETLAQYEEILKTGLVVEFIEGADPYAASPRLAIEDVRNNNHLYVFPTAKGFGSDEKFNVADNPLLAETKYQISGKTALTNDIFRAVHDYFGHVKEGNGTRADGEENAWRSHSAMYSPLARRAMTTETRGQNSWVNFGPHGETNRTAGGGETHYADQKIGLLPEWTMTDGAKAVEFILFTKTVETKIARAMVKNAFAQQHSRVEKQAARELTKYFKASVKQIVDAIPSFDPKPDDAKTQAASLIKRAFKASKQNDLLISHVSQPVADAFLEGAYAEMRLAAAAKRRKKFLELTSVKYNENHDEQGRFASSPDSGDGSGAQGTSPSEPKLEKPSNPQKEVLERASEIAFSDEDGKFNITGKGKAFEVFGKVVPAVTAYIQHDDPQVITFSALGKSRQRLYDRLVSTVLGVQEGRFAKKYDAGEWRHYVVAKNDLRGKLDEVMQARQVAGAEELAARSVWYQAKSTEDEWDEIEPVIDPDWFTPEGWEDDDESDDSEEPSEKSIKLTTASEAAARAEDEIDFPTEMPDWLKEGAQDYVQETFQEPYWLRIPETTRDNIEDTLCRAIENGKSIRDIASDIQEAHGDEYSKYRATMVARTEMTGSMAAGSVEAMRQAYEGTGVEPAKEWLSVLGTTTRETHADADGQQVPLDEQFTIGGHQCSFPGDASLPPEERCNCQCSIVSAFVGESIDNEPSEERAFDPDQPRDEHGQWTSGGSSGAAKPSSSESEGASHPISKAVASSIPFLGATSKGNQNDNDVQGNCASA